MPESVHHNKYIVLNIYLYKLYLLKSTGNDRAHIYSISDIVIDCKEYAQIMNKCRHKMKITTNILLLTCILLGELSVNVMSAMNLAPLYGAVNINMFKRV